MKSSHCPKYERKIWKILSWTLKGRIFSFFCSYFGQSDDFIFSFWNLLTFTTDTFIEVIISGPIMALRQNPIRNSHSVQCIPVIHLDVGDLLIQWGINFVTTPSIFLCLCWMFSDSYIRSFCKLQSVKLFSKVIKFQTFSKVYIYGKHYPLNSFIELIHCEVPSLHKTQYFT